MTRRSPLPTTVDAPTGAQGAGWDAFRSARKARGTFAQDFQVPEGEDKLVKFLDAEPFESYYRHWLRNQPKGQRQTFVCLGDDCPLCEKGDQPSFLVLFNVIDMLDDPSTVKVWAASPGPAGKIEAMAKSDKNSPINRDNLYFSVSKLKESNNFFSYSLLPVKDRDLEDDWNVEPLVLAEVAELARHGNEYIRPDSVEDLREIAETLE
jgi:hypothetical protein